MTTLAVSWDAPVRSTLPDEAVIVALPPKQDICPVFEYRPIVLFCQPSICEGRKRHGETKRCAARANQRSRRAQAAARGRGLCRLHYVGIPLHRPARSEAGGWRDRRR